MAHRDAAIREKTGDPGELEETSAYETDPSRVAGHLLPNDPYARELPYEFEVEAPEEGMRPAEDIHVTMDD